MNPAANTIANRLRLRKPQRMSLEILAEVCDLIPLKKGCDTSQALKSIQSRFPPVTDFERDFPSLCFALATGEVAKAIETAERARKEAPEEERARHAARIAGYRKRMPGNDR